MSEEAIRATLDALINEIRRYEKENRESHQELFTRMITVEKKTAKFEIIVGGGLFIAGAVVGVVVQRFFS